MSYEVQNALAYEFVPSNDVVIVAIDEYLKQL